MLGFSRMFLAVQRSSTPVASSGLRLQFSHVKDDQSKGYLARFFIAPQGSVMLHYMSQCRPKPESPSKSDERLFSRPLHIYISESAIARLVGTLEGHNDTAQFASREAVGNLSKLEEYHFRLWGNAGSENTRGGNNANKKEADAVEKPPKEFDVTFEPGEAVLLHRFLTKALRNTMGFSDPAPGAQGQTKMTTMANRTTTNRPNQSSQGQRQQR